MSEEDYTMFGIALAGFIIFALILDAAVGPRYHTDSGIGETLQGVQEGLWK